MREWNPDARIDHDGPVKIHRQLSGILAARIRRGDWAPNRPIPSELRLAEEYGVARGTVRTAVATLAAEGLVMVVPQRGTYVRPSRDDGPEADGTGR